VLAQVPVSRRIGSATRKQRDSPADGVPVGLAAVVLPVELDARRRVAGSGRKTAINSELGKPGAADAARSQGVGVGRKLCAAVASNTAAGNLLARRYLVSAIQRRPASRHAARDGVVLRLDYAGRSQCA